MASRPEPAQLNHCPTGERDVLSGCSDNPRPFSDGQLGGLAHTPAGTDLKMGWPISRRDRWRLFSRPVECTAKNCVEQL